MLSLRVETEDTPLQGKLDQLADQIGQVGAVLAGITFVTLVGKHVAVEYVTF